MQTSMMSSVLLSLVKGLAIRRSRAPQGHFLAANGRRVPHLFAAGRRSYDQLR
jgi:hypothetical protein